MALMQLHTTNHLFPPNSLIRISTFIVLKSYSLYYSGSNFSSFVHFHHTLFSWACGSPEAFSNSFYTLVCLITHIFLHGFQPNLSALLLCMLYLSNYFSLKYRPLYCRLMVVITGPLTNYLHKLSDTQSTIITV